MPEGDDGGYADDMHWMGGHAMDSMHAAEMEMMRRAMRLSLADVKSGRTPVQSPSVPRAHRPPAAGASSTAALQSSVSTVPPSQSVS
jgi:hypothetical protein